MLLNPEQIKVRLYLIEYIRVNSFDNPYVYYQDLCKSCGLDLNMRDNPHDRLLIGTILGDISFFEFQNNRPLISSIVVSKSLEQGDGFYKLCEEIGFGKWKKLKDDRVDIEMTRECYKFWQNDANYKVYK